MDGVHQGIIKEPTGIQGLDEITFGGLPHGRPTLIAGSAGSGKTTFAMQFLVHGALEYDQPGVFLSFEEQTDELQANFMSLGIDLNGLVDQGKLSLDHIRVQRNEFEETGEYDLDGLFIRLNYAIDQLGAKRVVLDTIETLFGGLPNQAILRAELQRLFEWLRVKGVTAVITGEAGENSITRQGLEEYVSDCVIVLNQRIVDDVSTRRLRVVKYRGSAHGTNEYPFLIDENGISVLPVTSLTMAHEASEERIPTGIDQLDAMLDGGGFFAGSSILISGGAGTGKSSVAAQFADAACGRGERVLYISFEESAQQLARNMRSIGLDLRRWTEQGLLRYHGTRATVFGLEMHLVAIHNLVAEHDPSLVVIDPMTSLGAVGTSTEVQTSLTRLVDFFKSRTITGVFTSLVPGGAPDDKTEESISSLMDAWLLLRNIEHNGERNRTLNLLKSRGMAHSNQVREFVMTNDGIRLEPVYVGTNGIYTGSARVTQRAIDEAEHQHRLQTIEAKQRDIERRRASLEARIAEMTAEYEAETAEAGREIDELRVRDAAMEAERQAVTRLRESSSASSDSAEDTA